MDQNDRHIALAHAVQLVTSGRLAGTDGIGIGTVTQAAEKFHEFLTADQQASAKPSVPSSKAVSVPKPPTQTAQPESGVEF